MVLRGKKFKTFLLMKHPCGAENLKESAKNKALMAPFRPPTQYIFSDFFLSRKFFLFFFLTSLHIWHKILLSYRRDPERGAEGANPEIFGTKLSGKRTVTRLNPGKIQTFGLDTDGEKFRLLPE